MFGYFEYTVDFWDTMDNRRETRRGVVYGDSYAAAASQIEDYYGEDIITLSIYALEPQSVYELD